MSRDGQPPVVRLNAARLAPFARPLPWAEIVDLAPLMPVKLWRAAIMDAEDRGLVQWLRPNEHDGDVGAWTLTATGRALVGATTH